MDKLSFRHELIIRSSKVSKLVMLSKTTVTADVAYVYIIRERQPNNHILFMMGHHS